MQRPYFNMANIKDIESSHEARDDYLAYHHSGELPEMGNQSLLLLSILQSSLELDRILELFAEEIRGIVPHSGIRYKKCDENCLIDIGEQARHSCSYHLVLLERDLGELTFYRRNRFVDSELKQLEALLAALIYPLRNALLYKKALEDAHRDPVTGVGNRKAMNDVLPQEVSLANRYRHALSIVMVDIDRFKNINDSYGHIAGDAVLKRVAESLSEAIRGSDSLFRYGGEEFLVLLRNTDRNGAAILAERLRLGVESICYRHGELDIKVTISAGITSLCINEAMEQMLKRCDNALYQAKQQGRNCIVTAQG